MPDAESAGPVLASELVPCGCDEAPDPAPDVGGPDEVLGAEPGGGLDEASGDEDVPVGGALEPDAKTSLAALISAVCAGVKDFPAALYFAAAFSTAAACAGVSLGTEEAGAPGVGVDDGFPDCWEAPVVGSGEGVVPVAPDVLSGVAPLFPVVSAPPVEGPPEDESEDEPPDDESEDGPPDDESEDGPPDDESEDGPPDDESEDGPPDDESDGLPEDESEDGAPEDGAPEDGSPEDGSPDGPPE